MTPKDNASAFRTAISSGTRGSPRDFMILISLRMLFTAFGEDIPRN